MFRNKFRKEYIRNNIGNSSSLTLHWLFVKKILSISKRGGLAQLVRAHA